VTTSGRPTVRPFDAADVPAAGRLLAERHAAHRRAEPLLAARFEDPAVAAEEVQALVAAGATGAVAEAGGELVGYLVGQHKPSPTWGANRWVEGAGHAVREAELARDLYAVAATAWVADGHDVHYALVPAHDAALVDAWFRLGFGQQHVHALRELPTQPSTPPASVLVRAAERRDIPVLGRLDLVLPEHQGLAPTFSSGGPLPTLAEAIADWEESFDDEGFGYLVAEHDGAVVGAAVACALEKSSSNTALTRPDHAGFLGFAAVLPEARGLGVGRALGEAVHDWCVSEGFTSLATDWRATNLLSSRAWPRLGYRPTFLRLHRRLGY
jgi:GNAT superfamily N-acetyltransferase